jgi:CheY-like chemotaxis protein
LNANVAAAPPSILVVDDEPLVLEALSRMLDGVCPVHGVVTLREAHEYLDGHVPAAVVLDVHLVDGFGWEILALLREVVLVGRVRVRTDA